MQHLIKRSTGPHAGSDKKGRGMTLAERLAANRQAAQAGREDAQAEPEEAFANDEPAAPATPQQPTPEPVEVALDTDAIVEAAKAARDGKPVVASNNLTCLVVDDSRVIRKVASGILRDLGFTVVEAENGEEALVRCKQAMPDLVLTDWDMPIMDGLDFVAELRKLPDAGEAKVIFCTSKGESGDIHAGIGAGADDYIVKPFDETRLRAKLQKHGMA